MLKCFNRTSVSMYWTTGGRREGNSPRKYVFVCVQQFQNQQFYLFIFLRVCECCSESDPQSKHSKRDVFMVY